MRFIAGGPSIPDELLFARDQGRVVFFCGAGVSRAKAKLPDFFELAAAVTKALGVQSDDPAMKIIAEAREIGARTGVDGLISADRIFGLLERDFLTRDIEAAVAKALTPTSAPDLSAHKTLLRLATTREGLVRLVTTNFDRLFDGCRSDLRTYTPPSLPDPKRATDFNGVVHLHGKTNLDGNAAEGDGFVLSSSEFGRAYLSDGWATAFVREILDRYFVVFVGYSADDPPVQYLLEALNRTSGPLDGVYAFQSGDTNYVNSRWRHKGVTAIGYDSQNYHAALWETLDAWAVRSDDPKAWLNSVVERAKSGPEILQPHERGQVAHVVSEVEGLRKFVSGDSPPPATWLCVFDPFQRYAKPGMQGRFGEKGPFVDPFDLYALDSDPVPDKVDPEDHYVKREVPSGAWDAFAHTQLDRIGLREENISSFRGHWSRQPPRLPVRQSLLGTWISKVSMQPEAVWWGVRQIAIHPEIRDQITWQTERSGCETPPVVRQAWRYLLDFWSEDRGELHQGWYAFADEVAKNGWSEVTQRRYRELSKPYMKVEKNFWGGPVPELKDKLRLGDLIRLDVGYPELPQDILIPDGYIARAVVSLRRNLEAALELETEIGGFGLKSISPLSPNDDTNGEAYSRSHGLSAWVIYFVGQFEKLAAVDLDAARSEYHAWPQHDETIFARLRIWALGNSSLVTSEEFRDALNMLPDEAFWNSYHARDLLLTLSRRWSDLSSETKFFVESRILGGPKRWEGEDILSFEQRKAWSILNIMNWLAEQVGELQHDIRMINYDLEKIAPTWRPEFAKDAARSLEGRGGWVRTETEHSILLQEPLRTTLSKAQELSGRQGMELVEYDPFAGLSEKHPVRAFATLRHAAKRDEFPEWAWRAFLNLERRKNDRARFTAFIGEQVDRYSPTSLTSILRPLTGWTQNSAKVLAAEHPNLFNRLIVKLTHSLSLQTLESRTAISRNRDNIDWTMEAINSPTASLAEALFDDPRKDDLTQQAGFPREWLQHVERLLSLPGDLRRHAIVIFAHNLNWFFYVDQKWTKANLLSFVDADKQDQGAFWAGFLWGGRAQGHALFEILKPHMLLMTKSESFERRGYIETLVGLLLSAWALCDEDTGERWVTNDEMRDVLLNSDDNVRSRILWQAESWTRDNREVWLPLLTELLKDVWPRQIAAKSGTISARLCDIAFSDEERFPELAAIVLPLLTKIDRDHLMLPNLRRSRDNIVDLHPRETLALLHAALPDNVAAWPYGIDATIARIGEADNTLNSDERLLELRRKWDAR